MKKSHKNVNLGDKKQQHSEKKSKTSKKMSQTCKFR